MDLPLKMVIFHSYVSLPEGTPLKNDGVRQLGLLFPNIWKNLIQMFQITNQIC